MNRFLFWAISVWIVSSVSLLQAQVPAQQETEFRLNAVRKLVEHQRKHHKIPGIALGVVLDGKVVLLEGFGQRNLGEGKDVKSNSLFPIASATKPITSVLAAMLVDQGKMDWDDPISKYLPDDKFEVDGQQEITIRDVFSHRSGFGRMSLLFLGELDRMQVIRQATQAKPISLFRKEFRYSNVLFTVGGVCAAKADGDSWDASIRKRIFQPLGMVGSSTSIVEIKNHPDLSQGYRWNAVQGKHQQVPLVSADPIGPAGSINSNVIDMCKWIQFLLNDGQVGENRLLSKQQLRAIWEPQIEMGPGIQYGLGWTIRKRKSSLVVEHGGNFGGFASQVVLIPERKLGFVLLMNVEYSPFQQESIHLISDALLNPMNQVESDLKLMFKEFQPVDDDLTGNFVASVPVFQNLVTRVNALDSGHVGVELSAGNQVELRAVNELQNEFQSVDDSLRLTFDSEKQDGTQELILEIFGAPRRLKKIPINKPKNKRLMQSLAGSYLHKEWSFPIQVGFHQGVMIAKLSEEIHVFASSDETERVWKSVTQPEQFQLEFLVQEGQEVRLKFVQPGPDVVLDRTEPSISYPELIRLIKKGYGEVADEYDEIQFRGNIDSVNQGAQGIVTVNWFRKSGQRTRLEFEKMARMEYQYRNQQAHFHSSNAMSKELSPKQTNDARLQYPWQAVDAWQDLFPGHLIEPGPKLVGESTISLSLFEEDSFWPGRIFLISPKTGRILREEKWIYPEGEHEVIEYSDFRRAHGIMFPFVHRVSNETSGDVVLKFTNASVAAKDK